MIALSNHMLLPIWAINTDVASTSREYYSCANVATIALIAVEAVDKVLIWLISMLLLLSLVVVVVLIGRLRFHYRTTCKSSISEDNYIDAQLRGVMRNLTAGWSVLCLVNNRLVNEHSSCTTYALFDCNTQQDRHNKNCDYFNKISPQFLQAMINNMNQAEIDGKEFDMDLHVSNDDGNAKWIHLLSKPLKSDNGKACFYNFYTDITERKKYEMQLKQNEEQLRKHCAQLGKSILIYNTNNRQLYVDYQLYNEQEQYRVYEDVPYSLVANGYVKGVEYQQRLIDFFENVVAGKYTESVEVPFVTAIGECRWELLEFVGVCQDGETDTKVYICSETITDRINRLLEAEKQSQVDGMTGLYNRIVTEKLISSYLTQDNDGGVFAIIDLDYFKSINDNYGHIAGDKAIVQIAYALKQHFGTNHIIGRFGGDEFVVFMKGKYAVSTIRAQFSLLLSKISSVTLDKGNNYLLHCSIGIAVVDCPSVDCATLYKRADQALYHVKRNGKNDCCIYSSALAEDSCLNNVIASSEWARSLTKDVALFVNAMSVYYNMIVFVNYSRDCYEVMKCYRANASPIDKTGAFGQFQRQLSSLVHADDIGQFVDSSAQTDICRCLCQGESKQACMLRMCLDNDCHQVFAMQNVRFVDNCGDMCAILLFCLVP